MLHSSRRYGLSEVDTAEALAKLLTEHDWTGCTGFYVKGRRDVLFLNDSTSADGAQEYAVFRDGVQVESITFGWCTADKALEYINGLLDGTLGEAWGEQKLPVIEEPHKTCYCCM